MDPIQTIQDTLVTQSAEVSVWGFLLNLLLATILSFILSLVYIRYGHALSNRRMLARNFVLVTLTTTLIITVVKSSLALSLGLVGALSIVRFRAAIKEPEELAYLFLAIALGLGFGADQRVITLIAFVFIVGIIWLRHFSQRSEENQNLYLTVSSHNPEKAKLKDIVDVLRMHCSEVNMKRFDDKPEMLEATFLVEFEDFLQLEECRSELQTTGESVTVAFLDHKGIA